jgi:hypothetical protein
MNEMILRFHVLKVVRMLILILWVVTTYGLEGKEQHFSPKNGDSMFHQNAGVYVQIHMALVTTQKTNTNKIVRYFIRTKMLVNKL